jgi:hypothetical protein
LFLEEHEPLKRQSRLALSTRTFCQFRPHTKTHKVMANKVVKILLAFAFWFTLCRAIGLEDEVNRLIDTKDPVLMPNFYAFDVLEDGEVERRFFLNGIALKETNAVYTHNGTK